MYDVAVVGLGPTGATLANLLGQQGLRVLVLDRESDVFQLPRAVHFDGECMRVFQTLGIAEALKTQVRQSPGMKFVDPSGRLLIDWSRPMDLGPNGWHVSYRCHQPWLERELRHRLAQLASVEMRLSTEVTALHDDGDGVSLSLRDLVAGQISAVRAKYVVGCDGARSAVRTIIGSTIDDLQSHERWIVVDVILKRERPDLGDYSIQYCDPGRPGTYVRGVGMRRRWELMLMPGDDPVTITQPEAIWQLLSRWVTPDEAELERPALYTFHSVVARGWRKGRLLIAGDAAHQTPPFMGQGMCAGIRDAANLGWKLGEVVRGESPESSEALLDSYESERAPHVREFIETAVRLGSVIQTTDREVAQQRDKDFAEQPEKFTTPQPALGPGMHMGGPYGGRLVPQIVDPQGRRSDDGMGYAHALVVLPAIANQLILTKPERFKLIRADAPALMDWLTQLGAVAVWVRPDRYVARMARTMMEAQDMLWHGYEQTAAA